MKRFRFSAELQCPSSRNDTASSVRALVESILEEYWTGEDCAHSVLVVTEVTDKDDNELKIQLGSFVTFDYAGTPLRGMVTSAADERYSSCRIAANDGGLYDIPVKALTVVLDLDADEIEARDKIRASKGS